MRLKKLWWIFNWAFIVLILFPLMVWMAYRTVLSLTNFVIDNRLESYLHNYVQNWIVGFATIALLSGVLIGYILARISKKSTVRLSFLIIAIILYAGIYLYYNKFDDYNMLTSNHATSIYLEFTLLGVCLNFPNFLMNFPFPSEKTLDD